MKNDKKKWVVVVLLLQTLVNPMLCARELTLASLENSADAAIGETILKDAYLKLGIEIRIAYYPAERVIRLAATGQVDGEAQHIEDGGEHHPTLIPINTAIHYLEAAVFGRSLDFKPSGWESLRPYRIGMIRSIRFVDSRTREMNSHWVNSYSSLFKMLENGRLDLAVAPRTDGLRYLWHSEMGAVRELHPPVACFPLFHTLHEKNRDLVEPIAEILAEMERHGELLRIRKEMIKELTGQDPNWLEFPNEALCAEGDPIANTSPIPTHPD
ncbi:MAG: substrate-binding periplasmic protein [Gammaproteobacteria bacterium]